VNAHSDNPGGLDDIDRALLEALQHGIEVVERPFAGPAEALGMDEQALVDRLADLLDAGTLTRFGPMFDAERLGGAFTLCAMAVPETRFEAVAELVNAYPETAHNYARDHRLNLWFVLGAEHRWRIAEVIADIERQTALVVLDLPKEEEFYIGLHLPTHSRTGAESRRATS